jgi:hypothetical protein
VAGHTHSLGYSLEALKFTEREWEVLRGDSPDRGFIPLGDLYYGPTGAHVNVLQNGIVRKIRPARQICSLPLAPISNSRLNYDRLRGLQMTMPETEVWWSWLSGSTITKAIMGQPRKRRVIARKFSAQDVSQVIRWGVLKKGHTRASHPIFKVPKGLEDSRLILDCRALNDVLPKPGDMGLPNLHEVYDDLLTCKYIAQVDARSYFYQFPMDREAQKWFGCTVDKGGGYLQHLRFTVLPMGFKFAPGIAQQTALHLLRNLKWKGIKTAWVDNFLFGGNSLPELMAGVAEFQKLCHWVGLDIKPPEVGTNLKILGARVDVQAGTITSTPEALYAMQQAWQDLQHPTPRKVFRFMGIALWQLMAVSRIPLCVIEGAIDVMRQVVPEKENWDQSIRLTTKDREALREAADLAAKGGYRRPKQEHPPNEVWWSDASNEFLGWVWANDVMSMATSPVKGIFSRELLAGATALLNAERRGKRGTLCIDNRAAEKALLRGLSSSAAGNIILRRLHDANLRNNHEVVWVSTKVQRADNPSRGIMVLPPSQEPPGGAKALRWGEGENGGDSQQIHS